jgi:hypothetical protein
MWLECLWGGAMLMYVQCVVRCCLSVWVSSGARTTRAGRSTRRPSGDWAAARRSLDGPAREKDKRREDGCGLLSGDVRGMQGEGGGDSRGMHEVLRVYRKAGGMCLKLHKGACAL